MCLCACPAQAQPWLPAGSEKRIGLTSLVWMEAACRWRLQINRHNSHNCVGGERGGACARWWRVIVHYGADIKVNDLSRFFKLVQGPVFILVLHSASVCVC